MCAEARERIRRTNARIGRLTVLEVSTKDIIYLKYDGGFPWRTLGEMALDGVASAFWPIALAYPYVKHQTDMCQYFMDPGCGVVYGHHGLLEYVVDLTQAKVESKVEGEGGDRVMNITVRVPSPEIDPMTKNLNLEGFSVLLRTKQFKDGDAVVVRMESLAKKGFVGAIEEVAAMGDGRQDARDAAMKALTALYRSAVPNANVDVEFERSRQ